MAEHKQVVLHGVPVVFPFEPYASQREYMASVIQGLQTGGNALLESPTGTGKTLSMLCAVLGWLRFKKSGGGRETGAESRKFPPILYCSRTHSQLAQVVREFKRTVYADDMVMAILGSREHLCVHSQVTGMPASSQGFQCAQLRSDNACRFFRGTARHMANESRDVATNSLRNVNLHDIEDLRLLARQENFCPYFYEREIAINADIIFLPYTYIIEKSLRAQLPFPIEGSVVIFDEAHNVPSALTSAGSHSVSAAELAGALRDLDGVISMMEGRVASAAGTDPALINVPWITERGGAKPSDASAESSTLPPDEFLGLASAAKLMLAALEGAMDEERIGDDGEVERPGLYMIDFLSRAGITAAAFGGGRRHLRGVLATATHLLSSVSAVTAMVTGTSGQHLIKILDLLNAVFDSGLSEKDIDESCRFVMQAEGASGGGKPRASRTLCFWCLDISVPMRTVAASLRQVLMTSGTLSPMSHFAAELGIPFPISFTSRHVIDTHQQLRSFVLKSAPDGSALNGSYAFRSVRAYYSGLGASIINLAVVVPDGMLVFFPSYAAMNAALAAWKTADLGVESTMWGQLGEHKTIFVEPPTTSELQTVVAEFQTCASQRRGAILFGVARGKISEGVDFADKHARCVVVTGIPFANSSDLFVKIKRRFLTTVSRNRPMVNGKPFTGDDWYKNEALRSVNQCIGRVIRHAKDFGVIVLADERFCQHTDALPAWVTQDGALTIASQFRDCFSPTSSFFVGRAKLARREAPRESTVPAREAPTCGARTSTATPLSIAMAMEHHRASGGAPAATSETPLANQSAPIPLGSTAANPSKFVNLFGGSKKPCEPLPQAPVVAAAAAAPLPANPSPSAVSSKTLISDLRALLSPSAYAVFKGHLEALVTLKRDKADGGRIVAVLRQVVAHFRAALPRERVTEFCTHFRVYAAPYGKEYDAIVNCASEGAPSSPSLHSAD